MPEQGDIVKAHCNICVGERKHHVIYYYQKKWTEHLSDDPPAYMYGEDGYELLQCAGCEGFTLRHICIHSEQTDEHGKPIPTVTYYPPSTFRRKPTWLYGTHFSGADGHFSMTCPPEFVSRLVEEIYTALHGDSLSLAAMGVRALLERVMIDRISDQGTFTKNLTAFQDQEYISSRQREILEATLDFGHASIHRDYTPSRDDLVHVLDMTENIIQMIYVSNAQAAEIRKRIPPRQKGA